MQVRFCLLLMGTFLAAMALPHGLKWTALDLVERNVTSRLVFGLVFLVGGIVWLELVWRSLNRISEFARDEREREEFQRLLPTVRDLFVVWLILLQLITVLLFAVLLDGHVCLWTCCYIYFVYAAGALVLAGRPGPWTNWVWLYLRWAWAPMIAFGIPLLVPTLQHFGLIPVL